MTAKGAPRERAPPELPGEDSNLGCQDQNLEC
jgi:hypothetical protein